MLSDQTPPFQKFLTTGTQHDFVTERSRKWKLEMPHIRDADYNLYAVAARMSMAKEQEHEQEQEQDAGATKWRLSGRQRIGDR